MMTPNSGSRTISLRRSTFHGQRHGHTQGIYLNSPTKQTSNLLVTDEEWKWMSFKQLSTTTGDNSRCIEHLTEAIRLNAQNRFQARLDSDFDGVAEDPRFTELLYPEA